MGKEVWVLTAGEYSDYRLVCVTGSEGVAKEIAKRVSGANDPICETVIEDMSEIQAKTVYIVGVDKDGREVERRMEVRYPWDYNYDYEGESVAGYPIGSDRPGYVAVRSLTTRGFDAALKAARDRLAELKARKSDL